MNDNELKRILEGSGPSLIKVLHGGTEKTTKELGQASQYLG
jgi:hypothetical protein